MKKNYMDIFDKFFKKTQKNDNDFSDYINNIMNFTQEDKERFYKIKLFYTHWLNEKYDNYSTELNHNFTFSTDSSIELHGSSKSFFITKWKNKGSMSAKRTSILATFNKDGEIVNIFGDYTLKDILFLKDKYNNFIRKNNN